MPSPARVAKRQKKTTPTPQRGLSLTKIEALTDTQDVVFDHFAKGQHLNLHGFAGTGKTFLALYLALQAVERGEYKKVAIFRSAVTGRSIGFLPGSEKEKMDVFARPYKAICAELYDRGDAWEILERNKTVVFNSTSFERGNTWDDTIIIFDEIQNANLHEIDTILTRVGEKTRLILCGDYRQTDLRFEDEKVGMHQFLHRIKKMESVSHIEFQINDIVRSDFVREWILTQYEDIVPG